MGQTLIDAAEDRRFISDVNRFRIATNLFRDRFGQLPGDFSKAYDIWGTTCHSIVVHCNGNNDKQILNASDAWYEENKFWRHLHFSELLLNKCDNGLCDYGGSAVPGVTMPRTGVDDSVYSVSFYADKNIIFLGKAWTINSAFGPFLENVRAYGIDTKIDDGLPHMGKVIAGTTVYAGDPACRTGPGAGDQYRLTNDAPCTLLFDLMP